MNDPQKWEYWVRNVSQFMSAEDLNVHSALGWELFFIHGNPGTNYVTYTFRRSARPKNKE